MDTISNMNINMRHVVALTPPRALKQELPISRATNKCVVLNRRAIQDILDKKDSRMLAIVGPCSIQNKESALEYAEKLTKLAAELAEEFLVVMRLYFAKPRTTTGWKGLFYDPHLKLNGSDDINEGARLIRDIAVEVATLELPIATEVLDPYMIQYIDDVVSWASIGARTVESQLHREIASGLSMPVGFKNATDGSIQSAIDALEAARHPHGFWGMDEDGRVALFPSTGNHYSHAVLRGGSKEPNYYRESVHETVHQLQRRGFRNSLLIDCSHGNSQKQYMQQLVVLDDVVHQRVEGNKNVVGFMLESNLLAGKQEVSIRNRDTLVYGMSITDACLGFEETAGHLRVAAETLQTGRHLFASS